MISRIDKAGIFGNAAAMNASVSQEAHAFASSQRKVAIAISVNEVPVHLNLEGRIVLHMNTRYDCLTSYDEDGQVSWLDDVNPDDDAQRIAVGT